MTSKTKINFPSKLSSIIICNLLLVSITESQCRFSDCIYPNTHLPGYACGENIRSTYSQAQTDCCGCDECRGVTQHNNRGQLEYSARSGRLTQSYCNDTSSLRILT
ncbi:hypothetical protein MHBO_001173 [Bonamia ostreae]|uniref:Uncharacterized protein n=1 Tax=Bonamia ostreae TaxID=126728 RepID=A0ABV2AI20_9EUKA